jgi:cytochrome c-type biogenesis protein CcmH
VKRWLALIALSVATAAGAVLPDEQLADPMLEARAREISRELRCVVCQNQSIDDSDAPLARDLRIVVREQLVAGKTDAEVKDFVVERYGNFVLLRPPFSAETWALWLGPLLVLAAGGAGVAAYLRGRRNGPADALELTPQELERVEKLLRDPDTAGHRRTSK